MDFNETSSNDEDHYSHTSRSQASVSVSVRSAAVSQRNILSLPSVFEKGNRIGPLAGCKTREKNLLCNQPNTEETDAHATSIKICQIKSNFGCQHAHNYALSKQSDGLAFNALDTVWWTRLSADRMRDKAVTGNTVLFDSNEVNCTYDQEDSRQGYNQSKQQYTESLSYIHSRHRAVCKKRSTHAWLKCQGMTIQRNVT